MRPVLHIILPTSGQVLSYVKQLLNVPISIDVPCISGLTKNNTPEADLLVVWRCFGLVVEGPGVAKGQCVERSEEQNEFCTYVSTD